MHFRYALALISLVVALPFTIGQGCFPAKQPSSECEQSDFYVYNQEQMVPLSLDVSRIGLYLPNGVGAEALDALAKVGIQVSDLTDGTLPGWYYAPVPADKADLCGVQQIVAALAAEPAVSFVAPVFLDEYGPIRMTQDIFVQFSSDISKAQSQDILDAAGTGEITREFWPNNYVVRSPSSNGFTVLQAANQLKEQHSEIVFAEVDVIFTARGDTLPRQWDTPPLVDTHPLVDESLPAFVTDLIEQVAREPVHNPPAKIWRWSCNGQQFYYAPPDCCDQFSILYDVSGNVICAPDGGMTGGGDGRCPHLDCSAQTLIWADTRSYPEG